MMILMDIDFYTHSGHKPLESNHTVLIFFDGQPQVCQTFEFDSCRRSTILEYRTR
jgi:hypothetical protein